MMDRPSDKQAVGAALRQIAANRGDAPKVLLEVHDILSSSLESRCESTITLTKNQVLVLAVSFGLVMDIFMDLGTEFMEDLRKKKEGDA